MWCDVAFNLMVHQRLVWGLLLLRIPNFLYVGLVGVFCIDQFFLYKEALYASFNGIF